MDLRCLQFGDRERTEGISIRAAEPCDKAGDLDFLKNGLIEFMLVIAPTQGGPVCPSLEPRLATFGAMADLLGARTALDVDNSRDPCDLR